MKRFVPMAVVAFVLASCARRESAPAPSSTPAVPTASAPTSWLCRPDRPNDPCRDADLSATELLPDGSLAVVAHHAAEHPVADCFYVYPTVDLDLMPGNHADFKDDLKMRATTLAQAARFSEACALWVPLYHQVTIGTYLQSPATLERGLETAFVDVERAFAEYLAHADPARKIVLVGHSQGAEMVVRLLRRFFDDDAALRARLLLALPIGGDVDVAPGTTRGGTLKNIPACTQPGETGCMIAYRTYSASEAVDPDRFAPPPGRETVCVNPAALDQGAAPGTKEHLSRAYFAVWPGVRRFMHGVSEVHTPFVMIRNFYEASCVKGERGYAYLAVASQAAAGDKRVSPVDFADKRLRIGKLGLHVLDMQLAQGDLVDLVARRTTKPQNDNTSPPAAGHPRLSP